MNSLSFEEYMIRNVYYNYLYRYYNSTDIASVYGVDKMEIKHSNVLKWVLEPNKNAENIALEYLPIRNLLKLIYNNNNYYDFFKSVNLDKCNIENVKVSREKNCIDLLITLNLNNEKYMIVIENKLESLIRKNQLEDYRNKVNEKYKRFNKKLFVFLHPGYHINSEQKEIVDKAKYISITYQQIYDDILKEFSDLSTDSTTKSILDYYIHNLSVYNTNDLIGLIMTDEEIKYICLLFKDDEFVSMIDSLYDDRKNEYTKYYYQNKSKFIQIFNKFKNIRNIINLKDKEEVKNKDYLKIIYDNSLINKVEQILKNKSYILNNVSYPSIVKLLKTMLEQLLANNSIDVLEDLRYAFTEVDPLFVPVSNQKNDVEHKNWYFETIKDKNNEEYYILSAWYSTEYDEIKDIINELRKLNPDIYGNLILE